MRRCSCVISTSIRVLPNDKSVLVWKVNHALRAEVQYKQPADHAPSVSVTHFVTLCNDLSCVGCVFPTRSGLYASTSLDYFLISNVLLTCFVLTGSAIAAKFGQGAAAKLQSIGVAARRAGKRETAWILFNADPCYQLASLKQLGAESAQTLQSTNLQQSSKVLLQMKFEY